MNSSLRSTRILSRLAFVAVTAFLLEKINTEAQQLVVTTSTNVIFVATNRVVIPKSARLVNTNIDLSSIDTFTIITNVAFTKTPDKYPKEGLNLPRIRYDWTDVLVSEDPSQPGDNKLPASYADIKGATFSYANNYKNNSDTWSANGALILPWVHYYDLHKNHFTMIAFAPSVSVNKVSDSAKPTNNVDHLDYRFGFYTKYLGDQIGSFRYGAVVRAAFVYGTDTEHRASLPAGELEIEPQIILDLAQAGMWFPGWASLGYQNILYGKRDNTKTDDIVDYKVRAWLHMEGGDLQQNGALWNTVDGSFFRLGPTVQGQLNFNNVFKGLSVSGEYGYQFDISGPTGKNSLYTLSTTLNLYKNDAQHQKLALTASYTHGGLTLSKQPVETLTVGLGINF